ncbi:MAG: CRISPR-associated protein Cas4 [Limisphaera sp.]
MIPRPDPRSQMADGREPLPLSLVNDHLYCPRRAALKLIEGWREANEHTLRGDIVHEHTDLAGYEVARGVLLWRALPVWSERLGLSGRCDIVEVELRSTPASPNAELSNLKAGAIAALKPVEFKLGKRRRFENDDAQLCAQALCLEEMFGIPVPRGAIFHADSKRRREVEFTPELRAATEQAVAELHALFAAFHSRGPNTPMPKLPAAVWRPACEECSLFDLCLPRAVAEPRRSERLLRDLFETHDPKS